MTTSFQAIRQRIGNRLGIYTSGTTTSAGLANGTTAVCNTIRNRKDGFYNDSFLKVPSLSAPNSQEVLAFVGSNGTFTFETAMSAQVPTATAIELYRYDPNILDEAIKQTIVSYFPDFNKEFGVDLVTGDWLYNGGFEEWAQSAYPDSWTKTANLTCAAETSIKHYGAKALKTTNTGATQSIYQSEAEFPELLDLRNGSVDFRVWCKTNTASHARIVVQTTDNGGTAATTYSTYHTGSNRWEILYIEGCSIPDDVRNIQFQLACSVNAAVAYWDQARVTGRTKRDYRLPSNTEYITEVLRQGSTSREDYTDPCDDLGVNAEWWPVQNWEVLETPTRILRVHEYLSSGYKLRLRGMTKCSVPTTDAGTTEIDSPALDYLVPLSTIWLIKNLGGDVAAKDRAWLSSRLTEFEVEAARMEVHKHRLPPVQIRDWKC